MKKEELQKYENLLLAKRRELLKEIGVVGDTHKKSTIKEATGDLSHYSYHMADQGTDNMEREMAFAFASKAGRLVYHIDAALERIRRGNYGKCQACGKNIQKARLRAVPHARLCIECKSAEEEQRPGRKR